MDSERKAGERESAPVNSDEESVGPPAWEQIEPGRYQPKRIRGSCRGLALG
jgi:hypothetical protein